MNIDKEFIKDCYDGKHGSMCSDWKAIIEKQYPEFKEEEFKVGDWIIAKKPGHYHWKDDILRIIKINRNEVWTYDNMDYDENKIGFNTRASEHYRKATKEEVESHLIKEAKRRGFKVGAHFKHNAELWPRLKDTVYTIKEKNYNYSLGDDYLTMFGYSIYENGMWAEVIETLTKKEAEQKLNCKIV